MCLSVWMCLTKASSVAFYCFVLAQLQRCAFAGLRAFIKRSQGTGRRGLKTHNAICSVSFFCFMFGRRCLSLLIYSILSFAPICLLSLLCPLSPFFCVSLLQGDCRTREEALILGVELCDNGFMHHGTALFAAWDFDRGNQMFFILLLKSRGILSLTG